VLSKALALVSVSIGAPLLGNLEGCSFLRAYEIKRYIKGDVKMPCKQVSLSKGVALGNLGDSPATTLREKRIVYLDCLREKVSVSGFLSWTQRTLRF
jgi:hypothetical protein